MDWTVVWGGDGPEDVLVTSSGRATLDGMNGWVQDVIGAPGHKDGLKILVDHRALDLVDLTAGDVRERVELLRRDADRIGVTWTAIVLTAPLAYGIIQLIHSYSNKVLAGESEAFYDIDDARAWLSTR